MNQLYEIYEKVKEKGFKLTQQRKDIILVFYENRDYLLEPSQVFKKILKKDKKINFSTVYRNIDVLLSAGILRKINMDDKVSTYELNNLGDYHHHLICIKCGKVKAIEACPYKEMDKSIFYENEFFPEDHKFEIYGYCKKCMENELKKLKTE